MGARDLAVATSFVLAIVGCTGAGGRERALSTTSGDYGLLERFAPQSATTWWAIVESNLKPKTFVVRTTDSGRHWQEVTPPVKLVSSSYFLSRAAGWVEAGLSS